MGVWVLAGSGCTNVYTAMHASWTDRWTAPRDPFRFVYVVKDSYMNHGRIPTRCIATYQFLVCGCFLYIDFLISLPCRHSRTKRIQGHPRKSRPTMPRPLRGQRRQPPTSPAARPTESKWAKPPGTIHTLNSNRGGATNGASVG